MSEPRVPLLDLPGSKSDTDSESGGWDGLDTDSDVGGSGIFTISDMIDAFGSGPFQIKLVVVFGALWTYLSLIASVQPFFVDGMIDRLELTAFEGGIISASLVVGLILGNTVFGFVADGFGRRTTIALCLMLSSVAGAAGYYSGSFWGLAAARVVLGASSGGTSMTINTYFAETCPSGARGRYLTIIHIFWTVGIALAVQLSAQFESEQWRMLMGTSCSAGILLAPLTMWLIPESPRWLVVQNHRAGAALDAGEASEVLVYIARQNRCGDILALVDQGLSVSLAYTQLYCPDGVLAAPPKAESGVLARIFSSSQLWSLTLPLWGCFFCANYAGYGNFMWLNEFLRRTGHKEQARILYLAFAATEAVGVVVTALIVDKVERKRMLALTFLLGGEAHPQIRCML